MARHVDSRENNGKATRIPCKICTCHGWKTHDRAKPEPPEIRGTDKETNWERNRETGIKIVGPPDDFRLPSIARTEKKAEKKQLARIYRTDGYLQGKRLRWLHAVGGKERWNSTQIALRTVKGVSFDIVNNNNGVEISLATNPFVH